MNKKQNKAKKKNNTKNTNKKIEKKSKKANKPKRTPKVKPVAVKPVKSDSKTPAKNQNILTRFFSHNITLMILSFVLAFAIWFIISISSETDSSVTISNIPVSIELSETAQQDGLAIFIGDDLTASVEVSGNRVTVGSLSSGDITVTASQTSSIITPGTYTLPLTAKKSGIKTNYEIVSGVTPSTVTVYVDKRKEVEFTIENRLSVQLEDSKHYANIALSQNSVIITGPEAQMKQIDSVVIFDTITADSDETKTVQEKLKFLDADGNELELPLVTAEFDVIDATITVMPILTVDLSVDTVGKPANCPVITYTPDVVKIAGAQTILDSIENDTISIGVLDFAKLKNEKYKLSYDISPPSGCKVISGETSAAVEVDLSSYVKTTVSCKITAKIDTTKYNVEFNTSSASIEIYGPEDVISAMTASGISVVADFTDLLKDVTKTNAVSLSAPITVTLSSAYSGCWVYGTYTATANVTMK